MKKKSFFKKLIACAAGTATMISCVAATTVSNIPLSAATDSNYAEALKLSLYFYDANQCGKDVSNNPLTWRQNCHTYDDSADLNSAVGLSESSKSFIRNANGGSDKVDVSGGYHDAGDHIKFNKTMGFSMTSLAWSYFSHPNAYKSTGSESHLLYILKNNADYLMKVTYLDGNDVVAYCYQVSDEGADHSVWSAPEDQTMNRTTYWADSSHSDGVSAGWMSACLASTSIAFKDKDPNYAAECLKYANALNAFAKKYPNSTGDGYGGMYANWNNAYDEIAFSELWCALAGNDGKLPSSYNPSYKLTQQGKYTGDNADYDLYTWDKAWSGYAALLTEVGYDTNTYINEMKFEYNNMGGLSTSRYATPGYSGWGFSRYNCALQMVATHIADATNDSSYYEACKYQMDYMLGDNPTGYSFLIGYGDKYALRYHHRASNPGTGNPADNTECKYVLYGALIGGCDGSGNYQDHQNEYKYTEPALDYNGCFALAISALVDKYGGDSSAADSIISNASEIDANFNFGGTQVIPTEPSTEVPTDEPTDMPTEVPTDEPTDMPTEPPTEVPTDEPTDMPTEVPTDEPTNAATDTPTGNPGDVPTVPPDIWATNYGDVDCNGEVDSTDIVRLNKFLLDPNENDPNNNAGVSLQGLANADCEHDGKLDMADSGKLINFVAEIINNLY